MLVLKDNDNYKIKETDSPNWFRVYVNNESIALCMSIETAFQVVYREIGDCDYLTIDDFIDVNE